MKDNKLDDLFKAGLSQNKLTPPPGAWDKIEAELPAKSKKGAEFFLSIAASLTLILSLGWIFISNQNGQSSLNTKQQAKVETEKPSTKDNDKAPSLNQPQKEDNSNEMIIPVQSVQSSTNLVAQIDNTPTVITSKTEEVLIEEKDEIILDIQFASPKSLNRSSVALIKGFKFQTSDYQESLQAFLSSQPTLTEIPDRRRFSLIGGLVSVAKGVNNTKVGISDLRKSKNEFVTNELKYGEKVDSVDDDEDSPLNK